MRSLVSRLRPEDLSAFVVLALLVLLLLPFWTQHSVRELHREIDGAADPARAAVTTIQYLLARQTSSLRGYVIAGDRAYLEQFAQLSDEERALHRELEPLVVRLGPAVQQSFAEMRTLSREWHQRLEREGVLTDPVVVARRGEIPFEQVLYHETLASAGRLDAAIAEATRSRREQILRAETRGAVLSAILALFAVAAALAVAHLGARIRRLARETELRRRQAEEAASARTVALEARARLLRGVGHDVKNPLGAADGYAELLEMGLKGELLPEQLAYVAKIRRSIHSALEVIYDLVELSRAETQFLAVERELVDCTALAAEVVEDYEGAARRSGLSLSFVADPRSPVMYTDPERIRRVIGNLLSNAIKYTPAPGRVEVRTELLQGEAGSWLRIEVADSGPGIPPDRAEAIFGEFVRLHSDAVPGHGLGLAISRRYARLLGGDLTVCPSPAGGAAFTLRLPVRASDP